MTSYFGPWSEPAKERTMGGMTGKSLHAGQTGRWLRRRTSEIPSGVAVLAAGSMLAALGLSACGPDVAAADTVLRSPRAATVELVSGESRPGVDGMTVPKGATVRTAAGGAASLVAARRTVLLGSATAVTVVDGEREQLRQGLVFIDARRSPGMSLAAGAATVKAPRGALARVERGVLLRAASFGATLKVQATGRRGSARVRELHQVQVPDGGRPGRETPLALTRDRWERRYALNLVAADTDLSALAEGLDRDPASSSAVMSVLPASYAGSASSAGISSSDTALAFVVAKAGGAKPEDVRALRADGGSWGVVAALSHADVSAISAALDGILNPDGGPVLAVGPAGPDAPNPTSPEGGVVAQPSPTAARRPTAKPSPRPSASRSPDPVQDVVTTVTGLLPTPTPVSVPLGPSPSPLLKVGVGGVGVTVGG
jgi:hypothetical protein